MTVARGVRLQVVTIATKIPGEIDQVIASLYPEYLNNQKISIEDIASSSFVVLALNVLYATAMFSGCFGRFSAVFHEW